MYKPSCRLGHLNCIGGIILILLVPRGHTTFCSFIPFFFVFSIVVFFLFLLFFFFSSFLLPFSVSENDCS